MTRQKPEEQLHRAVARFWSKVDCSAGPLACWSWMGATDAVGRGCVRWPPRTRQNKRAYIISYELSYGKPGKGLLICHHCDNPNCVNPVHLFAGTQKDNIQDAKRKGRMKAPPIGSRKVLNEKQVSDIRKLLAVNTPKTQIAKQYCIGWSTVHHIAQGNTWQNVQ